MIARRPIILIFAIYVLAIIIAELSGFFLPQNQSRLFEFAKNNQEVSIEGTIVSLPEPAEHANRFILKTSKVSNNFIEENILVSLSKYYEVSYGDIIHIEGKLSLPQKALFPLTFDYEKYLQREGIYTTMYPKTFEFIDSKPNPIKKLAFSIRKNIVDKIDKYLKPQQADVLKPIIIGDKSGLDEQTKNVFIDAGLMHILVVSGMNVAFVAGIFIIIFKIFRLPIKCVFLFTIPFIFLYVLATGANPPVLRAGIMFSCILICLSLDRAPLIFNSLALSALIILLGAPQQLFSISFQMSYIATISIVCFYEKLYKPFRKNKNALIKFFIGVLCLTVAAQILITPMCAYYFGRISTISLLANIAVAPMIGFITTGGFIFYFLSFISDFLAKIVSFILENTLTLLIWITYFFGQMKYACLEISKPAIWQVFTYFTFVLGFVLFKIKQALIFGAIILVGFIFCFITVNSIENKKNFKRVYENKNIEFLHIKENGKHSFLITQKSKKLDERALKTFGEFLQFQAIKNPKIVTTNFPKEKLNEIINR
ncbi:MAG: ComEC family competence protein [Elusimicrobiota bacterium]|jgi:competence protein ComEC|nr:ComEC family competence protein [Elusimicrobiota bacterium]